MVVFGVGDGDEGSVIDYGDDDVHRSGGLVVFCICSGAGGEYGAFNPGHKVVAVAMVMIPIMRDDLAADDDFDDGDEFR